MSEVDVLFLVIAIVFSCWLIGEAISVYYIAKRYREAKRRAEIINQLVKILSKV